MNLNGNESEDKQVPETRRAAVIGLAVTLLLVLAGLYLTRELGNTARIQDCVMSGRTNCAPINATRVEPDIEEADPESGQIATVDSPSRDRRMRQTSATR